MIIRICHNYKLKLPAKGLLALVGLYMAVYVYSNYTIAIHRWTPPDKASGFNRIAANVSTEKQPRYAQHTSRQAVNHIPQSKKVLLYTYMRGGSTFLGDLFKQNSEAVYWFEHMDGFYQYHYGLHHSTRPLNILYFKNATKRVTTEEESIAIADYHSKIYSCDYDATLLDLLTDYQNKERSTFYFKDCGITNNDLRPCKRFIANECAINTTAPQSFRENIETSLRNDCFHRLKNNSSVQLRPYRQRNQCYENIYTLFDVKNDCSNFVDRCKSASIHALKAIRLSMELVPSTLIKIPDLSLIYYARDPRAVIISRKGNKLLTYDEITEGRLLCERMLHDYRVLTTIKKRFPGRVLALKYEDLAFKPRSFAKAIYKFIGLGVPKSVTEYLEIATNAGSVDIENEVKPNSYNSIRNSSRDTAMKWRTKVAPGLYSGLTRVCKKTLQTFAYEL